MSNRAALYLRSSKDRSDVSIDAQRRALHETALQRGLVVVDEFADAVESGKDDQRPAFQRLIRALRDPARGWEVVLVLDTSRIARRRMTALIFEGDCEKRGVRLIYRSLPESDPATDMMLRAMMQAFDEYHSLTSRAKGLAGMAENVRQGWRAGGRAPRGYRLEHHATGAIRDGAPVTKSRLVVDDEHAPVVRAYLQLRAEGMPRGQAIVRSGAPWPASSTHAMDWQALTYAGHTVWNVEGDTPDGQKRRPRADWMIQRGTHEALITDEQAEAILAQMERAQQGRRNRASSLLLTGLLECPDGTAWHSDGCGFYRAGKGRKVLAERVDAAVLGRLADDLAADDSVQRIREAMEQIAGGERVDGRRLAALEKRIATATATIGRTVDLAARLEDPAPVLRRVSDLETQRAELVAELQRLRAMKDQHQQAGAIDAAQIRAMLRTLFGEVQEMAQDPQRRAELRRVLGDLLERIVLDPATLTARLHYAVRAGDMVATPRGAELSPVRWASVVVTIPARRRRAA